mmetsp:Transcript_34455/g.103922  ORF Transcript_34455/g.103922 Transcript_34455/m.103922 type:complete len:260 (+) Transcript_34455:22-801(+)
MSSDHRATGVGRRNSVECTENRMRLWIGQSLCHVLFYKRGELGLISSSQRCSAETSTVHLERRECCRHRCLEDVGGGVSVHVHKDGPRRLRGEPLKVRRNYFARTTPRCGELHNHSGVCHLGTRERLNPFICGRNGREGSTDGAAMAELAVGGGLVVGMTALGSLVVGEVGRSGCHGVGPFSLLTAHRLILFARHPLVQPLVHYEKERQHPPQRNAERSDADEHGGRLVTKSAALSPSSSDVPLGGSATSLISSPWSQV